MLLDVAIVGGSFAGLSAALQLARARRRVAVFDSGLRRNRFAASSHGFLAQDGRSLEAIVADARAQLAAYPTVQWFDDAVTRVSGSADAFWLQTRASTYQARRTILAIGVTDALPNIPGLAERWGRTVFHCPYCHGYELQQGPIAVIATSRVSLHQAQLLPEWGNVTFFLNGVLPLGEDEARMLAARGVKVEATPVAAVVDDARVVLADGRSVSFAGVFTASRTAPASQLATQLGCEHEEGLLGPFVQTDDMKTTSVPGVFACGDVARAAGNVALAVGEGALAGTAVHASLVFQP
jgi:thioredoxin reductase